MKISSHEAPCARQPSAIDAVNDLICKTVREYASDLHIEPMRTGVRVRTRIDGQLIELICLPSEQAASIVARIKVMSSLDIAETRLPQDGRASVTVDDVGIDIRVSTSPTAWGESVVLRFLGRLTVADNLAGLGLTSEATRTFESVLARPHGIILLTGPTGSGKTTTLYAALRQLNRPTLKILTVEDPVEMLIDGINQVQVRPEIGLTYAATLRAFLRQDPDILMIGEMRDRETADIGLRAALTGHLVLSTLHTNSALGAFTRLADLGIEPYLTASTVVMSIAQRLVRRLCPECRRPRAPDAVERARFEAADMPVPEMLFDPIGCEACNRTGWRGRLPLMELVEVDDALRKRIRDGTAEQPDVPPPIAETLYGHGLVRIAAGETSFAELARAIDLP